MSFGIGVLQGYPIEFSWIYIIVQLEIIIIRSAWKVDKQQSTGIFRDNFFAYISKVYYIAQQSMSFLIRTESLHHLILTKHRPASWISTLAAYVK